MAPERSADPADRSANRADRHKRIASGCNLALVVVVDPPALVGEPTGLRGADDPSREQLNRSLGRLISVPPMYAIHNEGA